MDPWTPIIGIYTENKSLMINLYHNNIPSLKTINSLIFQVVNTLNHMVIIHHSVEIIIQML